MGNSLRTDLVMLGVVAVVGYLIWRALPSPADVLDGAANAVGGVASDLADGVAESAQWTALSLADAFNNVLGSMADLNARPPSNDNPGSGNGGGGGGGGGW